MSNWIFLLGLTPPSSVLACPKKWTNLASAQVNGNGSRVEHAHVFQVPMTHAHPHAVANGKYQRNSSFIFSPTGTTVLLAVNEKRSMVLLHFGLLHPTSINIDSSRYSPLTSNQRPHEEDDKTTMATIVLDHNIDHPNYLYKNTSISLCP